MRGVIASFLLLIVLVLGGLYIATRNEVIVLIMGCVIFLLVLYDAVDERRKARRKMRLP